jgi:hypothetical protein
MNRLRTIPLAVAVLALSGGAALAFSTMPDASAPGLAKATQASGTAVPRRPVNEHVKPAAVEQTTDETSDTPDADAPDANTPPATNHGAAVSAVATADDTTPDTNHGADVSAVATANHGQTVAADHRPADAGKPADPGKPDTAGKP